MTRQEEPLIAATRFGTAWIGIRWDGMKQDWNGWDEMIRDGEEDGDEKGYSRVVLDCAEAGRATTPI